MSGESRFRHAHGGARCTVRVFGMQMIVNQCFGRINATSTAATDRELHLHLAQGARTLIHFAADLPIGNAQTYADVHSQTTPPLQ